MRFLAISDTAFDRHWRPHVPEDCVRKRGQRVEFYGRGCFDAWVKREVAKHIPAGQETKAEADRRRAIAEASLSEDKLAKSRNQTVSKREAEDELMGLVGKFIALLNRATSELATILQAEIKGARLGTVRRIVDEYFRARRGELLNEITSSRQPDAGGSDSANSVTTEGAGDDAP